MRDKRSFVLYRNWASMITELPNEQAGDLIKAICRYLDDPDALPEDPVMVAVFKMIKITLDEDAAKYQETCNKRKQSANARWKDANACKSMQVHKDAMQTDYDNDNDNDNESLKRDKRKRFTPPTLSEVDAYCKERHNSVNAEQFVDFYASKNWMVGKNKMADWKSAVRNWERRDKSFGGSMMQRPKEDTADVLSSISGRNGNLI